MKTITISNIEYQYFQQFIEIINDREFMSQIEAIYKKYLLSKEQDKSILKENDNLQIIPAEKDGFEAAQIFGTWKDFPYEPRQIRSKLWHKELW